MLIKNSQRISCAPSLGFRPSRFNQFRNNWNCRGQAEFSIVREMKLINNFQRKVFGFQRFQMTFYLCPSVVPEACGLLEKLEFPSIDLENRWESVPLQPSSVPTY